MLADELIPAVATRYGIRPAPATTAIVGRWTGGHAAIVAGLSRPDLVGHVFAESVLARDERDALVARIRTGTAAGTRFRLDWNLHERWDGGETTRALHETLRGAGFAVEGGERTDSAGWGAWRAHAGEALAAFFP
jgi:enterochelin esterase-like enzyme